MIYGSVCSGIEAATAAWHPLGWRPAFFSEIEPSCRDVLAHRWPGVPIHGDFTTIRKGDYERIDVLVGGTPCQDFSIAGLRKGITGDRGNLTLEFLRLTDRLRPTWVVWENVPGVLSIDKGRAFGAFLGGLAKLGYGFAYRVLDAQFYGVAQRRRRVFVVGYLGDWRPPAAVLFDGESLRGDFETRREARQESSCDVRGGVAGTLGCHKTGGWGTSGDLDTTGAFIPETAHTLRASHDASDDGSGHGLPLVSGPPIPCGVSEVSGAVSSKWAKGTGGPAGDECYNPVAFDSKGSGAHVESGNRSPTLRSMNSKTSHQNGGGQVAIAFQSRFARNGRGAPSDIASALTAEAGRTGKGDSAQLVATTYDLRNITSKTNASNPKSGDPVHTLHSGASDSIVALDLRNALRDPEKHDAVNRQGCGIGDDCAGTVTSAHQGGVATYSAIRRLTPRECERLQGFADDYTLVPVSVKASRAAHKKIKMMSDSARYRMVGNSMARPVMEKIGRRIDLVTSLMGE